MFAGEYCDPILSDPDAVDLVERPPTAVTTRATKKKAPRRKRINFEPELTLDSTDDEPEGDITAAGASFWEKIEALNWAIPDGRLSAGKKINRWAPADKREFSKTFQIYYRMLAFKLDEDGLCDRIAKDICMCVSHIIALGRDSYETALSDLESCQVQLEHGDPQSFYNVLPYDMKFTL